jgi:hypothetical protein
MVNNSEIPNEVKEFICNNKCPINYIVAKKCNPNTCFLVNMYSEEIMKDSTFTVELIKKANTIKELSTENFKLKEENATLKKENKLLNECFKLSEEIRNNSSEKKIIELQEDKRELQYKIQKLEYDLAEQIQLNVYLIQLLKEKEE